MQTNPRLEEWLQWMQYAKNDLAAATILLAHEDVEALTVSVCYHCEQAIEKSLKAYLVRAGGDLRKSHDLALLNQLCMQCDSDFPDLTATITLLTDYAVNRKYPGDYPPPSAEEATMALQIAESTCQIVFEKVQKLNQAAD